MKQTLIWNWHAAHFKQSSEILKDFVFILTTRYFFSGTVVFHRFARKVVSEKIQTSFSSWNFWVSNFSRRISKQRSLRRGRSKLTHSSANFVFCFLMSTSAILIGRETRTALQTCVKASKRLTRDHNRRPSYGRPSVNKGPQGPVLTKVFSHSKRDPCFTARSQQSSDRFFHFFPVSCSQ